MSAVLFLAVAAAIVAGMAQATQGVFNAAIARVLGPLPSALISMSVAACVLLLVMLVRAVPFPPWRSVASIAPYPLLVGGLLGATILSCVLFALPRIASASTVAFFILGQVVASLLLDRYGALGIAQHPITPTRLLGAGAVLVGAVLVMKG
ncbi:DMT family transporter [Aureimonas sp. ME7]|uniref:DMT family transporter n=1 Tax=Aureimonas sp. ME7 TaxID=2744252 RepID=UPI0015F35D5E|nr:DMT family transporter [Aureimonas sp. ME7]